MKINLMKAQTLLVVAVEIVAVALFVLYLGFMTHYYALFYDGTFEMFEYYKQLQVFNKEAFNLALQFLALAGILLVFELHKNRPGLFGLLYTLFTAGFISSNSLLLLQVLPKYRRSYLALDYTEMTNYTPSAFAFDTGSFLHIVLTGLLVILAVVVLLTFVQRLKEGNPIIRKLS